MRSIDRKVRKMSSAELLAAINRLQLARAERPRPLSAAEEAELSVYETEWSNRALSLSEYPGRVR